MNELGPVLKPFAKRVALLRAVQGMFLGLLVGGALSLVWVGLDVARVFYADWKGLGVLLAVCTVIGALFGFLRRDSQRAIALSIDRRAKLYDRLDAATEFRTEKSTFDAMIERDAVRSTSGLRPSELYPMRFGKLHLSALALVVLASSIFLLGNSPALRGPKSISERKELKLMGEAVKRVARPLDRPVNAQPVPEGQKETANELNKFARELEEGKINKEEALRKANDLAKKAEDQAKENGESAQKATDQAETALSKYNRMLLEEKGVSEADLERLKLSPQEQEALEKAMGQQGFESPKSKFSDKALSEMGIDRTAEKLAQLSPEQREQLRSSVEKQQQELQKEIDRIDKLPAAERKAMEAKMQELRKQQQDAAKLAESLKLSEKTLQALKDFMNSKEGKELQEMMQKMQQSSQTMKEQGKAPTKEEMEQMQKDIDRLSEAMKDPELRKKFQEGMKEALKQMEQGQMTQQSMQQVMSAMGLSQRSEDPSKSQDGAFADTGKVNKSEHEMETKGTAKPASVRGHWQDDKGEQWSVTVKAPTEVGNKSTVPYQSVLPQYKRVAEKALSGGKIPKGQEKRVKEYFDSLAGGKKK